MNLRIQEIANLAEGSSVIDIGADHGYLLIELYKKGFNKLLAVEKNKGPLDNCVKTLEKNNLIGDINLVLSDGLKGVEEPQLYDNIIIAGMGGDLIKSIIEQDVDKFKYSLLILQPNNNEYKLREYLTKHGFDIKKEHILEENNKIYEIIVAKFVGEVKKVYSEEELLFGVDNQRDKKILFKKWDNEYKYLQSLLVELNDKNIDKSKLENKVKIIKKWRKNETISNN